MRHRHSLAPDYLADTHAAAALVLLVMGVALFIVSLGMLVSGLTVGSSYDPSSPPPNADQLGLPLLAQAAITGVAAVALTFGCALVFTGTAGARRPTAVLAAALGVADLGLAVWLLSLHTNDLILPIGLVVAGLTSLAAGIVLFRPAP